jgi:hypothetical protein
MVMAKQDWKGGGIQLEIRCLAGQYQMAFGPVGKAASTLYTVKSEDYAPEHAGGFTGAVVGLYATGNGHVSQSPADFNWLDLAVDQEPKPLALSAMPSPTPVAARDAWRLRAGGKAWKDSQGNQWLADCLFQGGQTGTSDREVKGTTDSMLYQSDRWAAKFSYSLPVKPGTYKVTARFAETFWDKAGERVLKLSINGKPVLGHMDIYAKAGGKDRAVDFSFSHIAPGPGGRILLEFEAEKENAKVCALEVVRE